jgi:hypothetical protein
MGFTSRTAILLILALYSLLQSGLSIAMPLTQADTLSERLESSYGLDRKTSLPELVKHFQRSNTRELWLFHLPVLVYVVFCFLVPSTKLRPADRSLKSNE